MSGQHAGTRLALFGTFSIIAPDGRDATPIGRKAKGLLAMLALAPSRRRPRAWLQDRLWSGKPPEMGRASLRRELSNLRAHFDNFGIQLLSNAGDDVVLTMEGLWIDVIDGVPAPHHELLEGLDIGDPEFENWLSEERAYWYGVLQEDSPLPARQPPESAARHAFPHLAVLPFTPLSSTAATQSFAEGLNEEIQTVFGALSGSFHILSGEFANERSSDFLLRGSIRGEAPLRVAASVISSADGTQVWSGRFDAPSSDDLEAQELVARRIAEAVMRALRDGDWTLCWAEAETTTEAWELFQKGRVSESAGDRGQHHKAIARYRAAITADPKFLQARISLGFALIDGLRLCWIADPPAAREEIAEVVSDVLQRAPDHIYGRALQAFQMCVEQRFDAGLAAMKKLVAATPESPELLSYLGAIHAYCGNYSEEIAIYRHALTLTPFPPLWIRTNLAFALLMDGSDEAGAVVDEVLAADPNNHRALVAKTMCFVRQGKFEAARQAARRLKVIDPGLTAETWRSVLFFRDPATHRAIAEELRQGGV